MESILLLNAFVIFIFFFNFGLIHFSGIRVCVVSIVNLNAIWCWRCIYIREVFWLPIHQEEETNAMTDNAISIVYSDMRVPIEPVSRWPVKRQDNTLEARSTC